MWIPFTLPSKVIPGFTRGSKTNMVLYTHKLKCSCCRLSSIEVDYDGNQKTKSDAYSEAYCKAAAQKWYLEKGWVYFCYNCVLKQNSLLMEVLA